MNREPFSEERLREVLELFGDPEMRAREMAEYSASARAFDANLPKYIAAYSEQWIAVLDGEIIADPDYDGLRKKLDDRGIAREKTFVRFVDDGRYRIIV